MRRCRGVSVLELVTVLGIASIVLSLTGYLGTRSFLTYAAQDDHQILLDALFIARARSQLGICGTSTCTHPEPHGVRITPDAIVLFQGSSYLDRDGHRDTVFPRSSSLSPNGSHEYVFLPPLGTVTNVGETLFAVEVNYVVTVDSDGSIKVSVES